MFKLFVIAMVFGLAASLPLNGTTVDEFETALLVPEFTARTNETIVFETMSNVETMMDDNSVEEDLNELNRLKHEEAELSREIKSVNFELESERRSFEENEVKILDKTREAVRLSDDEILRTRKAAELVNEIFSAVNETATELMNNSTLNETMRLFLNNETLPIEQRMKLVGAHFNKTKREFVEAKEIELINLRREINETRVNETRMETELQEEELESGSLMEMIRLNEQKVTEMMLLRKTLEAVNTTRMEKTLTTIAEGLNKTKMAILNGTEPVKMINLTSFDNELNTIEEEFVEVEKTFIETKMNLNTFEEESNRAEFNFTKFKEVFDMLEDKMEQTEALFFEEESDREFMMERLDIPRITETLEHMHKDLEKLQHEYMTMLERELDENVNMTEKRLTENKLRIIKGEFNKTTFNETFDELEGDLIRNTELFNAEAAAQDLLKSKFNLTETEARMNMTEEETLRFENEFMTEKNMTYGEELIKGEELLKNANLTLGEEEFLEEVNSTLLHRTDMELTKQINVRSIMDQVTAHIQEKHETVKQFVLFEYCKTGEEFQYFRPYPSNVNKYVECNPWGNGTIRSCPEGRVWDQFHEICSIPEVLKAGMNYEKQLEELERLDSLNGTLEFNCNMTQYSCINGGVCEEFELGEFRCVCDKRFTGDFCEDRVVEGSIVSAIMTGEFNFTKFEETLERFLGNTTEISTEEMTEMKDFFAKQTHREIMSYVDLFGERGLRYDTVMNGLIESVLEDIYPEAFYFAGFNVTENTLLDVVRLLPSLMSYYRYNNERYTEVFEKYTEVLERLVFNLNTTWENATEDATMYIKITSHIYNETGYLTELFEAANKTNITEAKEQIRIEYNKTVEDRMQFRMQMTSAYKYWIEYMDAHPETVNMRLWQLEEYEMSKMGNVTERYMDLVECFDDMVSTSNELITTLFSYGFWLTTDALAAERF